MPSLNSLEYDTLTPALLIDRDRVQANISQMQAVCDAHKVELWPHIKTHKMPVIARMQLEAGARGLTCAKIGEAEVMLSSGVRRIFIAHSIVDPRNARRLRALSESLDQLIVACTSEPHAGALETVLAAEELTLPVMLGLDTGLGREGVRGVDAAVRLAATIAKKPHLRLFGIYSHEGHAYRSPAETPAILASVQQQLCEARRRIDPSLVVWPGCSVTAAQMAAMPGINGVRPGTYVFGDLSLAAQHKVMPWDTLAATILATVVDRPEPGLALIDAGSKTFSGDKTPEGITAMALDRRDIQVVRCNEEHGWTRGADVDQLRVGDRLQFLPAHICPAVNLADEALVISGGKIVDVWKVAARGKTQ